MCDSRTSTKTGLFPVNGVRSLLDICWKAKTIAKLMSALPKGMKPRYVHVIDAVWHINEPNGQDTGTTCVGDVNAFLGAITPSITKSAGEMADLGPVAKYVDVADRRAVTLTFTGRGLDIRRIYVKEYHVHLSQPLDELTSDQCETTVRTLTEAPQLIQEDFQCCSQSIWMNGGENKIVTHSATQLPNGGRQPISNKLVIVVVSLAILTFLGILPETSLNIVYFTSMEEFFIGASVVQWLVTGYLLLLSVSISSSPLVVRKFTTKALFIMAIVILTASTLLGVFAVNFPMLLAARLVMSLGTGISLSLIINIRWYEET